MNVDGYQDNATTSLTLFSSCPIGDSDSSPRTKEFTRSVAILDTKTWTWTVPALQGIPPSSRSYASAAILDGKHVTYAFGKKQKSTHPPTHPMAIVDAYPLSSSKTGSALNVQYNDINVLDVSSNAWLQSFGNEDTSSSSGLSTGVIVGVTIACVVLLVIILFLVWKFQAYIRFIVSRIHADIWKPR